MDDKSVIRKLNRLASKCIELDPQSGGQALLAFTYASKGDLDEAVRWAEQSIQAKNPFGAGPRGFLYGLMGRRIEALQMLNELEQLRDRQYVSVHHALLIHYAVGDMDAWRADLQQAYEERMSSLVFLNTAPLAERMRLEPEFQEIIRKIGLPRFQ